ncbi:autotransporter domain-containing protein [Variovorax paradoxus]|nr:autotransporter domain-containing protein [Variovorax paradoxus]
MGGLAGYSRASADTDARNSSAKTDSYHLGVYGGTQWGATALRLGANHSWNKTETSRSVAFAGFADSLSADYDSSTTQLFGEAGHRIDAGSVALEPFARLAYVRLHSDAFVERGGLAGVRTESQSHGADGGVDIWLYLQNASKPMIVQCKHWSRKVAVDDVRAFFGVLKSHALERGIFATSSTFTADASAFARAHGISAQNRAGLLDLIESRTPEQRALLLNTAYEGEYWRPTCASCGVVGSPLV